MRSPCLTSYLQEGGNFEERHTRTLERLNLSLATSVTFQDARYLMSVSILDENWQPLLPCASSFTHLHFTRKYVSQYYSRQGTLLNQEWSPFFNNNFLVRIIWTATPRIPCAGLNECDLVFKYFVFQTKYGRLQWKRINEDFSYEIGNLAGWGLIMSPGVIYCPNHTDIFYHKAFCLNHLWQQFFYSPLSSAIHVQGSCDHWTGHTRVEIILITGIHQGPCQSSVVGFGTQPRKRLGSKSGLLQCLSSLLKSSLCLMQRNKEASVIWKDLLGAHALLLSWSLLSWFLLGNWFFSFFF